MKQHYNVLMDQTEPIHQAEDQKCYQNYPQFDCHKMIDPEEGSLEEDSLEEGDSLAEMEDALEEEDTPVEEAALLELDHLVEDGDPRQCQCQYHKETNNGKLVGEVPTIFDGD